MPGRSDEQLGIVRVDDVGGEHAIVGRFLTQLVGFAGEEPFTSEEVVQITELTRIYGLDLGTWRPERVGREAAPESQASE